MAARIDLTGRAFGLWAVLKYDGDKKWLCRCCCGAERSVAGTNLRSGGSTRCAKCHNAASRTHGATRSRLYRVWKGMRARCGNPNNTGYRLYGGRGIKVCPEWQSFAAFRDWARANGYSDKLTIDRLNNDGDYEPSNCRWATNLAQQRNRRDNRPIRYRGRTILVPELAALVGMSAKTLGIRIHQRGWSVERAASTPVRHRRQSAPRYE